MRTMLAVTLVAFAVQGCKSQKVIAVETDIAAARGRVAGLEKHRKELSAETRRLQIERKTFSHQADAAALATERLGAAQLGLQGLPLPDGMLLDEALRAKSPQLGALAATIVQRQLPCRDETKPESPSEEPYDSCSPPLENACEGVSERTTQAFSWSCSQIVAAGRPTALCLATGDLEESGFYPIDDALTGDLEAAVVRVAFERSGRLVVADWPPPDARLYTPENRSELSRCALQNGHAECTRNCDVRYGRLESSCSGWGDPPIDFDEGRGGEEDTEPSQVRAAREAAEQAESDARESKEELGYQECLAQCEGGEAESDKAVAKVSLQYTRSPAPGLFQFQVSVGGDGVESSPAQTLLISFPELHAVLAGTDVADEVDTVHPLNTELIVQKLIEGKVVDGKRIYAGVTRYEVPMAVRIAMDGKTAPVTLGLDEVCAFVEELENGPFWMKCVASNQAREAREWAEEAAAAKAARGDGGVDGGVDASSAVAASVDAGVTP